MKVGICVKPVPATDSRIKVVSPEAGIDLSEVKWELNPYDEFALEEGLRMKDAGTASEVVVFTVGGPGADAKIREALARGADRAVRVDDSNLQNADCLNIARAIAGAVNQEEIQLLFAGKQAVDGDNAMVPAMVAEVLGWPQVLEVNQLEVAGEAIKAWRPAGGGSRKVVETRIPAVISCDKALNEPRYASLKGIMMAKRKKIDVKDAASLGLDGVAPLVVEGAWSPPPDRPSGRMLSGSAAEVVSELVTLLRDEAKVI